MLYQQKIRQLFHQMEGHPNPKIGQNFLVSRTIQRREVEIAELTKEDEVLDIGAGFGFLTEELARKAGFVHAIEKDRRIAAVLKERLTPFIQEGRVKVTIVDVMEHSLPKVSKIVSNPPYHVISPLIIKILRELFTYENFQFAVMILQKTYAERLLSDPGDKNWGRLPAALKYFGEGMKITNVPRKAFYPPPKVPSALVKIVRKGIPSENPIPFTIYEKITGLLFSYPKKKVRNAVKIVAENQNRSWRPIVKKVERKIGSWRRVRELGKEDIFMIADLFLEENLISN